MAKKNPRPCGSRASVEAGNFEALTSTATTSAQGDNPRVDALARWLQGQPADRPASTLPGFRLLFGDLTETDIAAASALLADRQREANHG